VISGVCARLSPVIFSMYRRTDPRSLRLSTHMLPERLIHPMRQDVGM
jgi:hypothetical protein